jgi:hypothetical protein
LRLYNGSTPLDLIGGITSVNNQDPDFTNVVLENVATFNRIDIEAYYGQSSVSLNLNFTYNILSSSRTTVIVESLQNPVSPTQAVNLQYLQNNHNIVTVTTGVSIGGGTIEDQRTIIKRIGPNGSDRIVEYFIRGTVTTSLGEAVLTLPLALPNAFILVSPYRNSPDGGGVDVFYGFQTNNSVYRVRHDFATSSNNRSFVAHIIGYDIAD